MIAILKQAEAGLLVKELYRNHNFSDATFYLWCKNYADIDVSGQDQKSY
ncbi:transposase [Photobacterium ganghwense]